MLQAAQDVLSRHADGPARDTIAVIDGARRLTYAELLARSFAHAIMLRDAGVGRGDRVGIFLRRSIDAVAALFGAWFAGGAAVVINEHLRARQVRHVLEHSEAACLVTDAGQRRRLEDAPPDRVQVIDLDRTAPPAGPFSPQRVIGADLALLIYTSGSTGLPKGVMVSHDNLLSGVGIVSGYLNLTAGDVILSLLPFSFDYGLNQVLTALAAGGTLVIQGSLFPPDVCNTLQREKVTGLAGVPTLWLQLTARHSPFLKTALPHLRYITNSGGCLPEGTVRLIRAAHPRVRIHLMYGLTEAFRSTTLPPEEVDRRPASIGKAIPGVEVLVVDEAGNSCGPGEAGELVHRGANVAMGYWRDPEATARVFRRHPLQDRRSGHEERVVFSGDLVKMDEEGYLYFVGRRDQQIKSRGFRLSPEEIETCLAASDLVANAVAFALPKEGGDTDIGVAVIPKEPSTFRPEALSEFCKREMPEYMRPRVIRELKELPLTSSGKVDRPAIRDLVLRME